MLNNSVMSLLLLSLGCYLAGLLNDSTLECAGISALFSHHFSSDDCHTFIGLVDFRGAAFEKNSTFEDLLSNYALEKIQKFVLDRITRDNVKDMKRDKVLNEKVLGHKIDPVEPDVQFFSAILKNLDEESVRYNSRSTHGESQDPVNVPGSRLFDHLTEKFSSHASFHTTSSKQTPHLTFSLKHHFGTVEYDASHMIPDNLDTLHPDFVSLCKGDAVKNIRESDDPLVRELFSDKLVSTRKHWRNADVVVGASSSKKPSRQPSVKRKRRKDTDQGDSDLLVETSSTSFQSSLDTLLSTLEQTVTWYVFGLNPNDSPSGDTFDNSFVTTQLEHFSIPQILLSRLECNDYSVTMPVQEFLERFGGIVDAVLPDGSPPGNADARVEKFCKQSGWNATDYAVGYATHSVYLAEGAYRALVDEIIESEQRAKQEAKEARLAAKSGMFETGSIYDSEADFSEYEPSFADSDSEMMSVSNLRRHREDQKAARQHMGGLGDIEHARARTGTDDTAFEDLPVEDQRRKTSRLRKNWVCFAWTITFCIPPFCLSKCGGMKRRDIQIAWREKVALCFIIFLMCASLLFFIIVLGRIICPQQAVLSTFELGGRNSVDDLWSYAYGRIFRLNELRDDHISSYAVQRFQFEPFLGGDVSGLFHKVPLWDRYCPGIERPLPLDWDNLPNRPLPSVNFRTHNETDPTSNSPKLYLEYMNQFAVGRVAWDWRFIRKEASQQNRLLVIYDNVYDVSSYFASTNRPFGTFFDAMFTADVGKDATGSFERLFDNIGEQRARQTLQCMNEMFYIGTIDNRASPQCQLSNYILLSVSVLIVLVILVKFLAALQFGQKTYPEDHDKFVILQVPCYTEGPESLTKTLESLATLKYDDKRKLLFVICDGM